MNGMSVLDPDEGRACLIAFHKDRDPSRVIGKVAFQSKVGSVKKEGERDVMCNKCKCKVDVT